MVFDKAYFDAGVNRIGTDCEKWDGMMAQTQDPDMIPMWVADMDFRSAPAIEEALAGVLAWGTWGYTIAGERGSGIICLNGAAAHCARPGDKVIIMSYAQLSPEEARAHRPIVAFVDEDNRITRLSNYERHGRLEAQNCERS
jgi:hypothetical protein